MRKRIAPMMMMGTTAKRATRNQTPMLVTIPKMENRVPKLPDFLPDSELPLELRIRAAADVVTD